MDSLQSQSKMHILLLNPNSSEDMTLGMVKAAGKVLDLATVELTSYTGPVDAPASINNAADIQDSTTACLNDLTSQSGKSLKDQGPFDAVLVACYSVHTLVQQLPSKLPSLLQGPAPSVLGIFEASVLTALSLQSLAPGGDDRWGIVTTGKFWEDHLTQGIYHFLGAQQVEKFGGVYSTGLNADDFHTVPQHEVEERLSEATRKLLSKGTVTCVIMGCGGMAGLEDIIRKTTREVYGEQQAKDLYIVDGVKAGILHLEQIVRSKRAFR